MIWSDIVTVSGAVRVITDASFTPLPAWFVRAASNGPVWAAVCNTGTSVAVIDSWGHRWIGPVPMGNNPVGIQAISGGWKVVWMQGPDGKTCGQAVLDDYLDPVSVVTIPGRPVGTSDGFLNFSATGAPIFVDDFRYIQFGALTVFLPVIVGPWVIGQDGNAYQIVAVNTITGAKWVVAQASTQTASFGTLDAGGKLAVVIAGSTTVVHEAQFTPWKAPVAPEPPIPTPEPPQPEPEPEPPVPNPEPPIPEPPVRPFPVEFAMSRQGIPTLIKSRLKHKGGHDYLYALVNADGSENGRIATVNHKTGDIDLENGLPIEDRMEPGQGWNETFHWDGTSNECYIDGEGFRNTFLVSTK